MVVSGQGLREKDRRPNSVTYEVAHFISITSSSLSSPISPLCSSTMAPVDTEYYDLVSSNPEALDYLPTLFEARCAYGRQ